MSGASFVSLYCCLFLIFQDRRAGLQYPACSAAQPGGLGGGAVRELEKGGGQGFRHCRSLWAACCLFSPTPRQAGRRSSPQVTAPPRSQGTVPVSSTEGGGEPLPPSPGDSRGLGTSHPPSVIGR